MFVHFILLVETNVIIKRILNKSTDNKLLYMHVDPMQLQVPLIYFNILDTTHILLYFLVLQRMKIYCFY